jgi:very-short-patch-repair endonuclease
MTASQSDQSPARSREGLGVGQSPPAKSGRFKPRNTERCQELRRAATPAERKLWVYLSRSQLGAKFSRQMPVGPYFADFLCRKHRLIVELDGFSHDIAPERDVVRDRALQRAGFSVLHFTNEDVYSNCEGVVEVIRLKLRDLAHP